MKKFLLLLFLGLMAVIYLESTRFGINLGGISLVLDENRNMLEQKAKGFLQDIQFKDFKHAANFHHPDDQKKADISKKIEKKFLVKPELLDIRHFEIIRIDVSDEGNRAKAISTVTVTFLGNRQTKDFEVVLYWKKINKEWFLDLESSL